ncbi:putative MFS allantoate transporter [Leptodontidium sp. MPI-SDFR-AT-0119]|nr:putative MFS allantoate transporter [Leptodontidium sp. MPI-SDFR-AT-0119]
MSQTDASEEKKVTELNSVLVLPSQSNADGAMQMLEGGGLGPVDPEKSKRLLRKVDLYIMPLICIVYFLQYIDKISISYASVMGLRNDTHLTKDDFNWVASIFFFGQLAFEFPTIRLIQLFPLAKYVSVNVIIWGAVLACLAACKDFAGLMVCRALLGVAEAAIVPAWVVFTSQWYKKEDQAFRVGIWFSMCGFAQMFGGFVAYGIATHVGKDPNAALKGWQVIFLFLGLLTVLVGITFFFVLPDSPLSAGFLSPEEKALHAEHLRGNEQGIGTTESLLLVTPLGAYEVVVLIGLTWLARRTDQRLWCCIAGHIPSIIGAILMATTEKAPALIGYYLSGGIPIGWTTILGLTSTNIAGSTKKVTVACIGTIAYTVGNIISPHTFQAKDAPRYLPAKISIVIIYVLITIDLYVIRWLAVRENSKRDAAKAAQGDSYIVEKNHEFLDLTDRQNPEFRYSL